MAPSLVKAPPMVPFASKAGAFWSEGVWPLGGGECQYGWDGLRWRMGEGEVVLTYAALSIGVFVLLMFVVWLFGLVWLMSGVLIL